MRLLEEVSRRIFVLPKGGVYNSNIEARNGRKAASLL